MSVRKLLINGLFIAVVAACAGLAACTSSKKGNCEICTGNSECSSGSCVPFSNSDGSSQHLRCADSSTKSC